MRIQCRFWELCCFAWMIQLCLSCFVISWQNVSFRGKMARSPPVSLSSVFCCWDAALFGLASYTTNCRCKYTWLCANTQKYIQVCKGRHRCQELSEAFWIFFCLSSTYNGFPPMLTSSESLSPNRGYSVGLEVWIWLQTFDYNTLFSRYIQSIRSF